MPTGKAARSLIQVSLTLLLSHAVEFKVNDKEEDLDDKISDVINTPDQANESFKLDLMVFRSYADTDGRADEQKLLYVRICRRYVMRAAGQGLAIMRDRCHV